MVTIVEYTDRKPARNLYPVRIISPTRAAACCFVEMEDVGPCDTAGQWLFRYRRCRQCGFTVPSVVRPIPETLVLAELREVLRRAISRREPNA